MHRFHFCENYQPFSCFVQKGKKAIVFSENICRYTYDMLDAQIQFDFWFYSKYNVK